MCLTIFASFCGGSGEGFLKKFGILKVETIKTLMLVKKKLHLERTRKHKPSTSGLKYKYFVSRYRYYGRKITHTHTI